MSENRPVADLLGWDPETGDRNVLYLSFEELAQDALWRRYLSDPAEEWERRREAGEEVEPSVKAHFIRNAEIEIRNIREKLAEADSLSMNVPESTEHFSPSNSVSIWKGVVVPSAWTYLGTLVKAAGLTNEQILDVANSKAWGDNGGLKKLASYLSKPIHTGSISNDTYRVIHPD